LDRKILILVVVIGVFGFGSAAALIIPIDLQITDNVKIYTKTTDFGVLNVGLHEFDVFCDDGDTFISGDIQTTSGNRFVNGVNGYSITSATAEGYKFLFDIFNSDTVKGILVCAKVVQNNIVGGFLLQPDNVALFLAYGIANAVWMAPLAIGIGAGVYLTKSKLKKN